jgi:ankyrin repeat protein
MHCPSPFLYPPASRIRCRHLTCVQLLLLKDSETEFLLAEDERGFTALHHAVCTDSVELVQLLLGYARTLSFSSHSQFADSVGQKSCDLLRTDSLSVLFAARDRSQRTPFSVACAEGALKAASLLLEHDPTLMHSLGLSRVVRMVFCFSGLWFWQAWFW